MDEEQYYTIILRHDTSTLWMTNDPILRLGELGVEDDTHKVKRGDGESKWSELPYEDFGLVYIVTFENLHGDLEQNEALVEAFEKKVSKRVFADVDNTIVASIIITDGEENDICKLTRMTKNIETSGTVQSALRIFSSDNSVQGYWNIDEGGAKVLDIVSRSAISDYEPSHTYFKDQICYYHNKLYRAYQDIVAGPTFNEEQWVLLASLHSSDIRYDNLLSGLDAENVKDAIDELKRRDDRKVQKSTEERIVYGTDTHGNQTVIPIDDLRKVDTVNHKQADLSKNVQIDASDINYSDADPSLGTVRRVLDSKVDKTFAGHGAKIVRNIQFNYNEVTGHIELVEDKVSPEDGSSAVESTEIDVVAERELASAVQTINDRIDTEVDTLNGRIDTEVTTLNGRIDTEVNTLNDRIDDEVETLNTTITTKETEIYNKIQDEHDEINERVDTEVQTLNDTIDDEVDTLNETITTKETALQTQITHNADEISRVETESQERDTALGTRITNEVATINGRIDSEVQDLNDRVDTEVQDINDRIDDEVADLNTTINTKETAMDNKKIDKSISETIVTFLEVATHDRQPTIKITNKNTTTETANYDYLHFGTNGLIKTTMEDADHIIIDSTDIDAINTQQNARLTNAESRLTAHDGQIATLLEHDVNHDRHFTTVDSQIANHETRLDTDEANITQLQQDLETEATTRENSDNALSQRITTNAVAITTKADKIFAQDTNNHVVGKLESDAISGNVILNLKETLVSPQDNSSDVERIKIISSDGTVVATRDSQTGIIDIRTNLDTDVNYFVTTDIISTTISAETTLDLNNLTPTDKQVVEVQDIISDPEGTWGRVKSVDLDNDECVVVTFKKHAQAVWGTIKGTLSDQADLQAELSGLADDIDDEETARESADTLLQGNIDAEEQARIDADTTLNTNKLDKDFLDNTTWAGGSSYIDKAIITGDITVSTGSSGTNDPNLTIQSWVINPKTNIGGARDRILMSFDNSIKRKGTSPGDSSRLQPPYNVYGVDAENVRFDADTSGLSSNYLASAVRELKGLDDVKVVQTSSADKVYGTDNNGNQTVYNKDDLRTVDTVNGVSPDANKNVELLATDIETTDQCSMGEADLETHLNSIWQYINNLQNDLLGQIRVYEQDEDYSASGNFVSQNFVTFTRADGVMLMAKVLRNFTSDDTESTEYESFMKDVELNNLKLVGIPEQQGTTPTPPTPPEEYEEVMEILNQVEGVQDTYEGLGGTESEVEEILDDILGNE